MQQIKREREGGYMLYLDTLEIKGDYYTQMKRFFSRNRDYVFFKSKGTFPHVLYLVTHGNKDGTLEFFFDTLTLEQAAKVLVKEVKKKYGHEITLVLTISCYGGLQQPCEVDGVRFQSFHDYDGRIISRLAGDETDATLEITKEGRNGENYFDPDYDDWNYEEEEDDGVKNNKCAECKEVYVHYEDYENNEDDEDDYEDSYEDCYQRNYEASFEDNLEEDDEMHF